MEIINDIQLATELTKLTETAINNVSDKVLTLLRDNIIKLVYELDYWPNRYYYDNSGIPTYEFLNAFKWEAIKNNITDVSRLLFYDWLSMRTDPSTFLHSDPNSSDNRESLAEALDVEGYDNGFLGGKLRGAYWKNTMDELLSGTLDDWFRIEMQALGFIRI
jgi:hypothetical protein